MRHGVAVVAWGDEHALANCLDAVTRQSAPPAAVVVADTTRTDGSTRAAEPFAARALPFRIDTVAAPRPGGREFTSAANAAMAALLAVEPPLDAISLLSQDTRIDPGWCARATAAFGEDPHAGIIGAKVRLPNGVTVRHAGGAVERPRFVARHAGHHDPGLAAFDAPREVDFVAGASMAMRTSALRTVGLFDSVFSPGSYEDVDLCARCRAASWSVRYVPDLAATHFETASFAERRARLRITHRNRFIYALGHLTDPAAREALFSSEIEHVRRTDDLDERHAIATACLSVMLGLPDILAARVPQHAPDVALQRDLIDIFTQLRTAALAASSGNP